MSFPPQQGYVQSPMYGPSPAPMGYPQQQQGRYPQQQQGRYPQQEMPVGKKVAIAILVVAVLYVVYLLFAEPEQPAVYPPAAGTTGSAGASGSGAAAASGSGAANASSAASAPAITKDRFLTTWSEKYGWANQATWKDGTPFELECNADDSDYIREISGHGDQFVHELQFKCKSNDYKRVGGGGKPFNINIQGPLGSVKVRSGAGIDKIGDMVTPGDQNNKLFSCPSGQRVVAVKGLADNDTINQLQFRCAPVANLS